MTFEAWFQTERECWPPWWEFHMPLNPDLHAKGHDEASISDNLGHEFSYEKNNYICWYLVIEKSKNVNLTKTSWGSDLQCLLKFHELIFWSISLKQQNLIVACGMSGNLIGSPWHYYFKQYCRFRYLHKTYNVGFDNWQNMLAFWEFSVKSRIRVRVRVRLHGCIWGVTLLIHTILTA